MLLLARIVSSAILIAAALSLRGMCAHAQGSQPSEADTSEATLSSAPLAQAAVLSSRPLTRWPAATLVEAEEQKVYAGQEQAHAALLAQAGAILSGTVTNANGDVVPGATITLEGASQPQDRRTATATETGAFQFDALKPGVPYQISIEARDLDIWKSEPIIFEPGQVLYLKDIRLKVPEVVTSITVYANQEQIATQQVEIETKQRVFGFIPNFYVSYDPNPVPLTSGLKFKLAFKADTDIITFVGIGFMAGIYQAGDMLDYGQGAKGYGKRVAAAYADTTSNIFLGGAIYPSLFRQDPRYLYQGTGSKISRTLHALSHPYICKGDNGKTQPNYSSLLGDLSSGAISNLYYPESNRGAGLLFQGFAITTGVRTINGLVQEFVLRKLTPSARRSH